jgi:superoxide dismutase, Cu-Zn family
MHRSTGRRVLLGAVAIGAMSVVLVTLIPTAGAAPKPLVRATLVNAANEEVGEVVFKGVDGQVTRVEVEVRASALPNLGDFHGFHIHTTGVCTAPFTSAGGHWNPTTASHGAHTGDMPSLLVHADGQAYAEFETDRFPVSSLLEGDGSAVILHTGRDNFANIPATYSSGGVPGPNATTLATGDAGTRYACGVVEAA